MSIALDGNQFCFIVQIYRIALLLVSLSPSFSLSLVFSSSLFLSGLSIMCLFIGFSALCVVDFYVKLNILSDAFKLPTR